MKSTLLALAASMLAFQPLTVSKAASRHDIALPPGLVATMAKKGMKREDPILIRTYKQESELEVWKRNESGRFTLLKTYPICRWSGELGPKRKEGDRQSPEGFYAVAPGQMKPNSNYHLAFNIGYPNQYDRVLGRTGSFLMVHGDCLSVGCYAMSDQQIEEAYALVREAQAAGQTGVPMQAFPFRFTAANMGHHRLNSEMPFWKNLKEGADRFDISGQPPTVGVCKGRYTFDRQALPGETEACGADTAPELTARVAARSAGDEARAAKLIKKGAPAISLSFVNGGQNPFFANRVEASKRLSGGPLVSTANPVFGKPAIVVAAVGYGKAALANAIARTRILAMNALREDLIARKSAANE